MPKVYITGPNGELPGVKSPTLQAIVSRFADAGYEVVTPADIDARDGFENSFPIPENYTPKTRMPAYFVALCGCDYIALQQNWHTSTRASLEFNLARVCGLGVLDADDAPPKIGEDGKAVI